MGSWWMKRDRSLTHFIFLKSISYRLFATSYSRICLIRQFVTFSSVPAKSPSFVFISVHLIRHRLIRQFAQFVTSFYPLEALCSANTSFVISLLMSKQSVHVEISENCCTSQFVYRIYARGAKRDFPLRERGKSSKIWKVLEPWNANASFRHVNHNPGIMSPVIKK